MQGGPGLGLLHSFCNPVVLACCLKCPHPSGWEAVVGPVESRQVGEACE